jgi:phosphatidylserine decarboxylase
MLAHDPLAHNFVGGTIYQSYMSATSYHRWHSPVSGIIVKAYVVPGTYYAEAPDAGLSSGDMGTKPDVAGANASQSYIMAVATRAAILIKASNPCLLPAGMAEVSTCDITVSVGQHVKKGDELGTFHYGGSTACMIVIQKVDLVFDLHRQEGKVGLDAKNIWVNERIAVVIADTNG